MYGKRFVVFLFSSTLFLGALAQQDTTRVAWDKQLQNVDVVGQHAQKEVISTTPLHLLNQEAFRIQGMVDLTDALHRLPGITLRDYGGAGGMKTVSVRGLGAQHTSVVYDGIALSDCQTGQIDLSRYSLDHVEQIGLTVGDADEIFVPARNISTAATLNIQTLTPPTQDTQIHGKAQLSLGSWGYTHPALEFHKNSGKVAYQLMGDYIYADNDYPFTLVNVKLITRERRVNSRMNQGHAEGGLVWQINDRNRLDTKLYYYDNNRRLPGIVHLYTQDNDEKLHDQNAFGQLRWHSQLSSKVSLLANGKYNWSASAYSIGLPTGGITSQTYWQRELYGSACVLYVPFDPLSLDYSADYFRNSLNSTLSTDNHASRQSFLQSVTAKYRWNGLSVIARLLYSNYWNTTDNEEKGKDQHRFSPSVSTSLRLLPDESVYLRASWKSIFRMPNFNELYYYHLGNSNLNPEKTSQWNVGLTWQHSSKAIEWTLTADGYLNQVTDKIISIPFNMFVWRTMNVDKVRIAGLDATLDMQWHLGIKHTLGLNGNYSLQRAENRANKEYCYGYQIAYTPQHSGSMTLSWTNPWVNLSFSGEGQSHRYTTNEHSEGTRMPGYMEFGASAYRSFKIGRGKLTARFSVQNLLDKQYDLVMHYPMPGRSWRASLTYEL